MLENQQTSSFFLSFGSNPMRHASRLKRYFLLFSLPRPRGRHGDLHPLPLCIHLLVNGEHNHTGRRNDRGHWCCTGHNNNNTISTMDLATSACRLCRAPCCDLKLLGCGCTVHAVSSSFHHKIVLFEFIRHRSTLFFYSDHRLH